jgi:hypothetical protein
MPTTTNHGFNIPTVGADADEWGTELNDAFQDFDTLTSGNTLTMLGRVAGGAGPYTQLTAAQITTIPNAVVGDAGAGGTKGLVPAPAAGDAAARKFLMADGTWVADERKAWAVFTGATGALVAGRNVAISRAGAGDYDITFSTALASTDYAVVLGHSPNAGSLVTPQILSVIDKTVNGFTIGAWDPNVTALVDPVQVSFEVLAA